jgi:hypothetical protein
MNTWTEFVRNAHATDHGVHVYRDVDDLAASVATFLAAGFERGEPAVVVARAANRAAFERALDARGWTRTKRDTFRLLTVADAEETLEAILVDGHPSRERFESVVGTLLDRAADLFPGRRPRVFGEMVDVLCDRGDANAAVELEEIWSWFGGMRRFSLLCGYRLDIFDRSTQVDVLPKICAVHTHVLPEMDLERLERAVDAAFEETFGEGGPAIHVSLDDRARDTGVPRAQLALMWISEQAPKLSEQVLCAARAHYDSAAATT